MKNYYDSQKERELSLLKKERESILNLQNMGKFPKIFECPTSIQLELTQRCNLKCIHCYNNSGTDFQQETMSPSKWKDFATDVVKHGGVFHVILSGGEPLLLGDHLFEIMDIFHHDGSVFLLISNGYLLDRRAVEKLAKYQFLWLQISIDGVSESIHDSFRGIDGSFKKAIQASLLVTEKRIPLVIAHTVTPDNLSSLLEMVHLSYELGASGIIIGEVSMSGKALNPLNGRLKLTVDEKNQLYQIIDSTQKEYAGRMDVMISSSTFYQLSQYRLSPNAGFVIRPNGDIRLDCMAPFTIGNVLQDNWFTIWKQKGIDAWNHDKVIEFIENIDREFDINPYRKNYYDQDVKL